MSRSTSIKRTNFPLNRILNWAKVQWIEFRSWRRWLHYSGKSLLIFLGFVHSLHSVELCDVFLCRVFICLFIKYNKYSVSIWFPILTTILSNKTGEILNVNGYVELRIEFVAGMMRMKSQKVRCDYATKRRMIMEITTTRPKFHRSWHRKLVSARTKSKQIAPKKKSTENRKIPFDDVH